MALSDEEKRKNLILARRYCKRLVDYLVPEKLEDLKQACKQASVTYKTVTNFLQLNINDDNKHEQAQDKIANSTSLKNGKIREVYSLLPDMEYYSEYKSYIDSCRMKGVSPNSQRDLAKYHGRYVFLSNIPDAALKISRIGIHAIGEPFFPRFKFKIKVTEDGETRSYDSHGYLILDGSRIVFSGLASHFNTIMVIKHVIDHKRSTIKGVATIEDKVNDRCLSTELILLPDDGNISDEDVKASENILGDMLHEF